MLVKKKSVQRLSEEHAAINQQLLLAKKQYKIAEQEQQEAVQDLWRRYRPQPIYRTARNCLQLVKMAQKEGNIDALLEKTRHEIEQGKKDCLAELKRLGHWSGDLTDA